MNATDTKGKTLITGALRSSKAGFQRYRRPLCPVLGFSGSLRCAAPIRRLAPAGCRRPEP